MTGIIAVVEAKMEGCFAKTIVFCVDQEHAWEIRAAHSNLNADLVRDHPDYVTGGIAMLNPRLPDHESTATRRVVRP